MRFGPPGEEAEDGDKDQRCEAGSKLSFLAVPAGRPIPQEATSTDWLVHAQAMPLDEDQPAFPDFGIAQPGAQLREKGYAITDLQHQRPAPSA